MTKVKVFGVNDDYEIFDEIYDLELPLFFVDCDGNYMCINDGEKLLKQIEIHNYISNDGSFDDDWDNYLIDYFERESIPDFYLYYLEKQPITKEQFYNKLSEVLKKMSIEHFLKF